MRSGDETMLCSDEFLASQVQKLWFMKSGLVNQVKFLELVRCLYQTSAIQQRYQFAPHPLKECSSREAKFYSFKGSGSS